MKSIGVILLAYLTLPLHAEEAAEVLKERFAEKGRAQLRHLEELGSLNLDGVGERMRVTFEPENTAGHQVDTAIVIAGRLSGKCVVMVFARESGELLELSNRTVKSKNWLPAKAIDRSIAERLCEAFVEKIFQDRPDVHWSPPSIAFRGGREPYVSMHWSRRTKQGYVFYGTENMAEAHVSADADSRKPFLSHFNSGALKKIDDADFEFQPIEIAKAKEVARDHLEKVWSRPHIRAAFSKRKGKFLPPSEKGALVVARANNTMTIRGFHDSKETGDYRLVWIIEFKWKNRDGKPTPGSLYLRIDAKSAKLIGAESVLP